MPIGSRRATKICTVQIGTAAIALFLLSTSAPAKAQPLPPENQRTVEWYRAHPTEREQVRRLCLNDPGHLARSPDCINAQRGDLAAAISPSRRDGTGIDMSDPDTPEYWTRRPTNRTVKLAYCSRLTAADAARATCRPAQQSLLMEQQRGSGR